MKYENWQIARCEPDGVRTLTAQGVPPLVAALLCSRGVTSLDAAREFLSSDRGLLVSAQLMPDMDKAAARLTAALDGGESIAVYGDYDVDGITSTCLLTEYLTSRGGHCTYYIPDRIDEGYGLNEPAVRRLASMGVTLIVTVDCGVTAVEEVALARELGIDVIVTDHHECKDRLPDAVAVIDPHRKDSVYPFPNMAGVGVAFKLACAMEPPENQDELLTRFCELLCLGTVADVMPLTNENRCFVSEGLASMPSTRRLGLRMLMQECGCAGKPVTTVTLGFVLAPRINAAGRMGQATLAAELLLTRDPGRASALAAELCALNRRRQSIELEIQKSASAMLKDTQADNVIVLGSEGWHQGVVGIVASRLAEEFCRPVFLISFDGQRGKASSRSYGGFNLFAALESVSDLLDSYGGHELAAGFTIDASRLPEFRERVGRLAAEHFSGGGNQGVLALDCELPSAELLTLENVASLSVLEPCGAANPQPVFYMRGLTVSYMTEVGGGKHLKLWLSKDGAELCAMFFSMTALGSGVAEGDTVEIAFTPQINEFRGARTVQLLLCDIRPEKSVRQKYSDELALYRRQAQGTVAPEEVPSLLPARDEFVALWRYLKRNAVGGVLTEDCACLARKVSRSSSIPCSFVRTRICLDVFEERGLIRMRTESRGVSIRLTDSGERVELGDSLVLTRLKKIGGR